MKERYYTPDQPLTDAEKRAPTKDDYVPRKSKEIME
jgi:hypothetical protein